MGKGKRGSRRPHKRDADSRLDRTAMLRIDDAGYTIKPVSDLALLQLALNIGGGRPSPSGTATPKHPLRRHPSAGDETSQQS